MELETQDFNNTSFQENSEIIPSIVNNKPSKTKLYLIFSIILITLIIFYILIFLIFPKNYNNVNLNISKDNMNLNDNLKSEEIYKEKHIDTNYKRVSPNDENYIYIPLIGTNDFHGRFFPTINEININSKKIKFKTGGLEYIARYINILREEFGNNRVLYFDIGDQFFQTNETILFDGENIQEFLNKIGLNGTTFGNHEFLYKREWLENKIKNANYPYICNNIKDKITNKKKGALGENHETSHLYEIHLDNGDIIKIGVIGITLNNGVDKKFYTVGNIYTWDNLTFQTYETDLEEESNKLKAKGANAIILLSHIGLLCDNLSETAKLDMYDKTIQQSECRRDGNSLLYKFLNKLKPGIIDAIIGGDTHNTIHHWLNDIPIMITKGRTNYLNVMYLPFKKDINNKYILVKDEIKIEGPLPSCEKIFSNLNHCEKKDNEEEYLNSGELVEFYWHGKKIEKDIMTKELFDKYHTSYKKAENIKITNFIGYNGLLKFNLNGDSILSFLMMDAIKNIMKADISIANIVMFQSGINAGPLSILDFIKLFPRQKRLCTTKVSGDELIKIVEAGQSGERGFNPTSGLKQTIKIKNGKKTVIKVEMYVNDTLVDIDKNKIYILASNNVILYKESKYEFTQKDSLEIIRNKYVNNEIKCSDNFAYVDIMNYFKNKKVVDLSKEVDMSKPRIVIIEE